MFGDEQETYIDLATLRLADGACEELAMRCELLRSAFAAVIARLDTFAPANHAIFGDCEEGRGWWRVVHDAVRAPTGSLTAILSISASGTRTAPPESIRMAVGNTRRTRSGPPVAESREEADLRESGGDS
ncbi:Hypothetical protein ERS075547_06522 [Mycobacteroides abscessus]|nr:Hypothetical protein ERS075547_06522 [Mycobacteroides abscessus]